MYKTFFIILITIITALTLCISVFKPDMHKLVMVYDSQYIIVDTKPHIEITKTTPVETKPIQQPIKTVQTENITIIKPQTKQIKSIPNIKTNTQIAQPVKTTTKQNTQQKTINNTKPTNEIIQSQQVIQKNTVKPEIKPQIQSEQKHDTVQQTPQEEIILWNKWRSNIQNQIMKDAKTKLPLAPDGTEFRVSFDVDKYGKVTNIHTSSTNPNYTNYAIQCIPPIVRSYQGRTILEFPNGSNRISTTVECAWRVSQTAKYSTSKDYNDTEKVVK